jgi:hypothetical protein
MPPYLGIITSNVAILAPRMEDTLSTDRVLLESLELMGSLIIALLVALLLT